MNTPLLERTLALLYATKEPLRSIAQGADVGHDWLKKLKGKQIENPSVNRIERLHEYLSSRNG